MKIASTLLVLAALALSGCGSDDTGSDQAGSDRTDFGTLREASDLSDRASEQAKLAIAALGQSDTETATTHIEEAEKLTVEGEETLGDIESAPVRNIFIKINRLTLEGYRVLNRGIDASARGDDAATDRYIRRSMDIRRRKLQLFNETDFASIGVGESNERLRQAMSEQLRSAVSE
ncbi:MAG TPA: hypothetical protein VMF31_00690 [Solirubrobacterales bacterium]|nr:hypothetical protein [Solirubrobacterales bacterium]